MRRLRAVILVLVFSKFLFETLPGSAETNTITDINQLGTVIEEAAGPNGEVEPIVIRGQFYVLQGGCRFAVDPNDSTKTYFEISLVLNQRPDGVGTPSFNTRILYKQFEIWSSIRARSRCQDLFDAYTTKLPVNFTLKYHFSGRTVPKAQNFYLPAEWVVETFSFNDFQKDYNFFSQKANLIDDFAKAQDEFAKAQLEVK